MDQSKKPIGLVIDEGADLPREIIEKYQIEVTPFKSEWPEIENLPGDNIFQRMREVEKRGMKTFGKTSQPSPKNFLDCYKRQLEKSENILCITLTSKLSGTYNSAVQAKNFLTPEDQLKITIIDSLNGISSEGLIVIRAIELIEENKKNVEEIAKELTLFIPTVKTAIILKDPKWLEFSGRLSHNLANLIRRMQSIGIRPIVSFKNGKLTVSGFKTGAKNIPTALFKILDSKTKKFQNQGKKIKITIVHGDNIEYAKTLKNLIEKEIKNSEICFVSLVDMVIGVVAGPDALSVSWAVL